jgi:hypothetical protein
MRIFRSRAATLIAFAVFATAAQHASADNKFVKLFDGKTLNGWKLVGGQGPGYVVKDGLIVVPADGGGKLMTEKEYSDFVFKCEFNLDKGGNNGVGIRAPFEGDAAYNGMEIQVLDDYDAQYANLLPGQYCGSVYRVLAAKRGALKHAGEWNKYEISAIGRQIKVTLNGQVIVNDNLNNVTDKEALLTHPGFRRDRGHVGFLGHGPSEVRFREVYIKDLSKPDKDNTPPQGFKAAFNGKDLTGWKGLVAPDVGGPAKRATMTPAELAAAQVKADQQMRDHWKVADGMLVYDGKGQSLCTSKDYGDFEMLVDWQIEKGGDSGIYLRGSPQVQIWDNPLGSGGLYNNQKNPSNPTVAADKPVGEWNRFRILMVGDKVTVYLNDVLVTNDVTMENYWERSKPIYPMGQIELQHHGSILHFKNVYLREITAK